MKEKKSYSEIMKARTSKSKSPTEDFMLDMYIRMIFDESVLQNKKRILEEKINEAIDTNNKPLFMELALEYKKILKQISA